MFTGKNTTSECDMYCTQNKDCTQNGFCQENKFKRPKSYSAVLKENKELMVDHLETLKELEMARKTIQSLRELNTKLMFTNKEKDQEINKIVEQKVKADEQGKLFLRTYTNMSIEMLKMEEKLAKHEHRVW